jgi:hypothetical protein
MRMCKIRCGPVGCDGNVSVEAGMRRKLKFVRGLIAAQNAG